MASKNIQFKYSYLYRDYIYLSATLAPHCEGGGVYDLSNNRFDTITTLGGFKSLKTVYPTTGVGSYV